MDSMCLAILKSRCGEWHFFDHAALQVATTSFALLCVNPSDTTETVDKSVRVAQDRAELLEGFSIEQWASYAKRKSHIASAICKENGKLKARFSAQGCDVVVPSAGIPRATHDNHDAIFENDPWGGASVNARHDVRTASPSCDEKGAGAWSNYHGSSSVTSVSACANGRCSAHASSELIECISDSGTYGKYDNIMDSMSVADDKFEKDGADKDLAEQKLAGGTSQAKSDCASSVNHSKDPPTLEEVLRRNNDDDIEDTAMYICEECALLYDEKFTFCSGCNCRDLILFHKSGSYGEDDDFDDEEVSEHESDNFYDHGWM
jgi:hypothetical protein